MSHVPRKFVPHPFQYHEEVELVIDSLSNQAVGVGRIDGWVIFVPASLPGERVKARIYRNEKNCSHADLVEVLEASPDRVTPECPAYGRCGGCQYQHLSYEEQLKWKTQQVEDLLRLQAGLELPVLPATPSPVTYGYRSKITPHFQRPKDAKISQIGFLRAGTRSEICDIQNCPIAMEEINEALPIVRKSVHDNAAQYKKGATILMRVSEGQVITNNNAVCTEQIGDLSFNFLAGDFFQNNPFILPAFTDYVAKQACQAGARFLVDAYCGSGLFALSLASHFEKVLGVEVSETSADWARANARLNNIEHASFLAASAEAIFEQVDFPAEETAVVIDPPRKGCDELFLKQLFAFGPKRVIYVSCNPATQVRDLAEFDKAGYTVIEVQPFDLFPQTKHLECVVTLEKLPSFLPPHVIKPKISLPQLTASAEDYLEVIGKLCRQNGQAQVSEIALALGVKKPSVTAAIRHLSELGLVEYKSYAPVKLTEMGEVYADKVIFIHEMLSDFFQQYVGFDKERAAEIACHMEHQLNDNEITVFSRFLDRISTPHKKLASQS